MLLFPSLSQHFQSFMCRKTTSASLISERSLCLRLCLCQLSVCVFSLTDYFPQSIQMYVSWNYISTSKKLPEILWLWDFYKSNENEGNFLNYWAIKIVLFYLQHTSIKLTFGGLQSDLWSYNLLIRSFFMFGINPVYKLFCSLLLMTN